MDRKLASNFIIPAGSVPIFSVINSLILGVGLFISIFAVASAALVEKKRRHSPNPSDMSVFWLFPQFFLIGSAEVFSYVGQLEFFYDEATDGTRSISSAMFLSEIGIGSWLSTAIVKIIERATGGEEKGWLRNNLNLSKLAWLFLLGAC
ncbi:protein NRT1/ PTR FAMILY 8.2-like [Populus alba x Populus x berolinensis]|nr:protein NRT1/ PTR FAMILY 8.2-like [Populus alba x Populus x berolinensis]